MYFSSKPQGFKSYFYASKESAHGAAALHRVLQWSLQQPSPSRQLLLSPWVGMNRWVPNSWIPSRTSAGYCITQDTQFWIKNKSGAALRFGLPLNSRSTFVSYPKILLWKSKTEIRSNRNFSNMIPECIYYIPHSVSVKRQPSFTVINCVKIELQLPKQAYVFISHGLSMKQMQP